MMGLIGAGVGAAMIGVKLDDHGKFKKAEKPYTQTINAAANKYGISRHILAALLFRESSFNPTKRGKAGEIGIAQIMPIALADLKKAGYSEFASLSFDDLANPDNAIFAAAALLQLNKKRTGNIFLALRAYNVGPDLKSAPGGDNGVGYMSDIAINGAIDFLWETLNNGNKTA